MAIPANLYPPGFIRRDPPPHSQATKCYLVWHPPPRSPVIIDPILRVIRAAAESAAVFIHFLPGVLVSRCILVVDRVALVPPIYPNPPAPPPAKLCSLITGNATCTHVRYYPSAALFHANAWCIPALRIMECARSKVAPHCDHRRSPSSYICSRIDGPQTHNRPKVLRPPTFRLGNNAHAPVKYPHRHRCGIGRGSKTSELQLCQVLDNVFKPSAHVYLPTQAFIIPNYAMCD